MIYRLITYNKLSVFPCLKSEVCEKAIAILSIMDPEAFVPCPFDKAHMIRYKRFQYHVMECKQNFPNHNMEQCPFNARHWVPKPELRHHTSICPDKRIIESEIEYENSRSTTDFFGGNVSVPPYNTEYAIDASENWDDVSDSDHPTFVLGQTAKLHQKKHPHTVEVETTYVPANKKSSQPALSSQPQEPILEPEVRMPKNVPQVLQSQRTQAVQSSLPSGRGYGRGYAVPSTQASVQLFRGRGQGLMMEGSQFRSLSDVVKASSLTDQPSQSRCSPVGTPPTHVNGNHQELSGSQSLQVSPSVRVMKL